MVLKFASTIAATKLFVVTPLTPPPAHLFNTSKQCNKQPSGNPAFMPCNNEFHIPQLPEMMRWCLQWPKSAAIMEKWSNAPARQLIDKEKDGDIKPRDIPRQNIDTTLITWAWLSSFQRVLEAEAQLLGSLSTTNAQETLRIKIQKNPDLLARLSASTPIQINNPQSPIDLHSDWQFQFADVGYKLRQMDDLYGALGNFMLAAAVTKARLTLLRPGVARLSITEVGLYARDTFDFNDKQYLGHWSAKGFGLHVLAAAGNLDNWDWELPDWRTPAWHPKLGWAKPVHNSDFRNWRQWTKRGGDLLLFSDVKLKPVQLNVDIDLKP